MPPADTLPLEPKNAIRHDQEISTIS